MHPIITIFCPFTRRWAVDRWLEDLSNVEHDPALTNLCFIIDLEELYIRNMLKKFAEDRGYRSFHFKMNEGHAPNETRISARRHRIAEIHEQAKDLIAKCDGDIVVAFEDDTVFDRLESFDRLITPLTEPMFFTGDDPKIGFVEGVQMGRWGAPMIGAWIADHIDRPTRVQTLLPDKTETYQSITGGGWYGYATLKSLFLQAPYFDSPSNPWGPDVEYGFWLRRMGYKCLIDWSTIFGHNDYGQVIYSDGERVRLAEVIYNKNEATGKWERTDNEPTRY